MLTIEECNIKINYRSLIRIQPVVFKQIRVIPLPMPPQEAGGEIRFKSYIRVAAINYVADLQTSRKIKYFYELTNRKSVLNTRFEFAIHYVVFIYQSLDEFKSSAGQFCTHLRTLRLMMVNPNT